VSRREGLRRALSAGDEYARRRVSPTTKRRLRRLVNSAYWSGQRLRRLTGRTPGASGARDVGRVPWLPGDPLPGGALDCLLARNEHGIYCIPRASKHRPVAQTILQARVWEADTIDLMGGTDRSGDIVHAGTFFGDFIPALARSRESGAIVWAFEPGRENYRCARITAMLNDAENVVLTNAGLDSRGGSALLVTSDREGRALGGESSLVLDPSQAPLRDKEEVELVAIDEVVPASRRVAVIQLDVEGHEQAALAGALLTIERCRPLIILESLPEKSWLAENLAPLGYEADGSVNRNFVLHASNRAAGAAAP
jgi:FkbM family methyltransferase